MSVFKRCLNPSINGRTLPGSNFNLITISAYQSLVIKDLKTEIFYELLFINITKSFHLWVWPRVMFANFSAQASRYVTHPPLCDFILYSKFWKQQTRVFNLQWCQDPIAQVLNHILRQKFCCNLEEVIPSSTHKARQGTTRSLNAGGVGSVVTALNVSILNPNEKRYNYTSLNYS